MAKTKKPFWKSSRFIPSSLTYLFLIAAAVVAPRFATAVEFKADLLDEFSGLLVVISFVSVAVKSAVTNFVDATRNVGERVIDGQKVELIKEVRTLKKESPEKYESQKAYLKAKLIDESQETLPEGEEFDKWLVTQLDELETEIERYDAATKLIRNLATIAGGLLASLAGLRTLETFCIIDELQNPQLWAFHIIDILLTAGLILGGRDLVEGLQGAINAASPAKIGGQLK